MDAFLYLNDTHSVDILLKWSNYCGIDFDTHTNIVKSNGFSYVLYEELDDKNYIKETFLSPPYSIDVDCNIYMDITGKRNISQTLGGKNFFLINKLCLQIYLFRYIDVFRGWISVSI